MKTPSTAKAMTDRIRAHYIRPIRTVGHGVVDQDSALPGAVVLTEVPAPGRVNRRIDALAIGLTSARKGLDGFEVKISRADWLKELDQPAKADPWFQHTHRWWVAASSAAIVDPQELPEGWGLMVPDPRSERRMKIVVKAASREAVVDWPLLWELTKKLDRERATEVKMAVSQLYTEMREQATKEAAAVHEQRAGDDANLGRALSEITGLDTFKLKLALQHGPDWMSRVLTALFTVAADPASDVRDWVTRELEQLTSRHRATSETLGQITDLLIESSSTAQVPA